MKLFQIASAVCLIVLIGQTSAFRIVQSESELPLQEIFKLQAKEYNQFNDANRRLNLEEKEDAFFDAANQDLKNKKNAFFHAANRDLKYEAKDFLDHASRDLDYKEDAFFARAEKNLNHNEEAFFDRLLANLNLKGKVLVDDLHLKEKVFVNDASALNLKEKVLVDDVSALDLKEKVVVNKAKPIYVTGQSRRVVVPASKPIVIKPEAVVIRQKGDVEVRPIHITRQPAPVIVTKKIVRLHRPVIKKFYVEQYRKKEAGAGPQIISEKVSQKTCNCPTAEHIINPNINWAAEANLPLPKGADEVVVEEDF